MVVVICLLVPNVLIIIASFLFVEETPLDLVTHYHPPEVVASLQRVASINGVLFDVTVEEIAEIRRKYEASRSEEEGASFSVLDLFRYPSLRCISITLILLLLPWVAQPNVLP